MPILAKTGNEAMAEAMRQINPDVVAAYPITPATEIAQIFSSYVADGLVDTEFVAVESEHSAMSATLGAAASGVRAMTATSSQGLALMYEILPIVSALRLPVVMPEVNRALSGPINIHCDHSDTMAARDFGWIQIFSEDAQEAYDNVVQAIRIAEELSLPAMVTTDGFIISHCMSDIEVLDDAKVKDFIGVYKPKTNLLDLSNPISIGLLDLQDYYFEHKMPIIEAMRAAADVVVRIGKEFGEKFGREYGLYEKVGMDDAEAVIVCLGSTAGTAKSVIAKLRQQGKKVGLLKLRVFRPFPHKEIARELENVKTVAVMDRSDGYNASTAPLFGEIRSAMYESDKKPKLYGFVYGLGGREISAEEIEILYHQLLSGNITESINYIGYRK